jgi:hypothetical protein
MDDLEKKTTAVLTKVSLIYWYKQNKYKLNWFIKYDVTENFIRNFISMIFWRPCQPIPTDGPSIHVKDLLLRARKLLM